MKFISYVVDTGEQILGAAVNLRLFGYFWPVSTTLGNNFIAGVNDTAEKLFTSVNDTADKLLTAKTVQTLRQQYLWQPMMSLQWE